MTIEAYGAAAVAFDPCQFRPAAPLPAVPSPKTVETGTHMSPPESEIPRTGVGAQIQFLIADKLLTTVVDEDHRAWKLNSGRVAKKKTEGISWVWASDDKALSISRENEEDSMKPSSMNLTCD
jgi:hypothetical protein